MNLFCKIATKFATAGAFCWREINNIKSCYAPFLKASWRHYLNVFVGFETVATSYWSQLFGQENVCLRFGIGILFFNLFPFSRLHHQQWRCFGNIRRTERQIPVAEEVEEAMEDEEEERNSCVVWRGGENETPWCCCCSFAMRGLPHKEPVTLRFRRPSLAAFSAADFELVDRGAQLRRSSYYSLDVRSTRTPRIQASCELDYL